MAVEIEAKMSVESFDAVRARLRELGARPAGARLETNRFFDTADGHLRKAGEGLRVRVERTDGAGGERAIITWKGPRRAGPLKSRAEVELEVASGADAETLLQKLGYVLALSFEKRRESWTLDGCKIELDELPRLGMFIEIEGPDEGTVMSVRQRLGLSGHALIGDGYASLLRKHLKARGEERNEIRFDR